MKQSISELLNKINIEKIDSLKIDHKNNIIKIKLLDWNKKQYELELSGVDNYHYIDDYIYVKENDYNNVKGVSFYDSMPWAYMALTYDANGNLIDKTEVEPNFVLNSKDKSLCLKINKAKLDGNDYPIFKNSFLINTTDVDEFRNI